MTAPSQAQHRAMHRLWAIAEVSDRADRLALTSAIVRRPLASSNDLTDSETRQVLDYLTELAEAGELATRAAAYLARQRKPQQTDDEDEDELPEPDYGIPTRPGPAFSNGTEWEIWSAEWCQRCRRDAEFYAGSSDTGCELPAVAMFSDPPVTPAAWFETDPGSLDRYSCIEFRSTDPGDDDPEPKPLPEPDGMVGLFPRPERRVRMLAAAHTLVPVGGVL